jgi:hypothetical protein
MKTWLICESCAHVETTSENPREELMKECRDTAQSCFALVCKLISKSDDIGENVLNSLIHCRQCVAECEKYDDVEDIEYCSNVCAICADTLKDLAVFYLN